MNTIAFPRANPTRESLTLALVSVIGFALDGGYHHNGVGAIVRQITPDTTLDDTVILSVLEPVVKISLRELLDSEIFEGYSALRLPNGRKLELYVEKRAMFSPVIKLPV